jgi:hypothetical protein
MVLPVIRASLSTWFNLAIREKCGTIRRYELTRQGTLIRLKSMRFSGTLEWIK